jgi:cytochrome c553
MKKAATVIAAWALMAATASVAADDDKAAADGAPLLHGGDPEAGAQKVQKCVACHGQKGNSPQAQWPNIAGQHAGYLYKQLRDFKAGDERQNAQMTGMVAGLSKDDMRDIAAYYSQQPHKVMGASDEQKVERGRRIYLGGIPHKNVTACAACHGPQGKGNPAADYPAVGGQWPPYLAQQLQYFRSGERANDANAMMRSIASEMTDAEIEAVAEYMAGLN